MTKNRIVSLMLPPELEARLEEARRKPELEGMGLSEVIRYLMDKGIEASK